MNFMCHKYKNPTYNAEYFSVCFVIPIWTGIYTLNIYVTCIIFILISFYVKKYIKKTQGWTHNLVKK